VNNGDTPLILAVKYRMKKVAIALINHDAKTSIINDECHAAIDFARKQRDMEDLVYVLKTHSSIKEILIEGNIKSDATAFLLFCIAILMMIMSFIMKF